MQYGIHVENHVISGLHPHVLISGEWLLLLQTCNWSENFCSKTFPGGRTKFLTAARITSMHLGGSRGCGRQADAKNGKIEGFGGGQELF